MQNLKVKDCIIGNKSPCFIIGEVAQAHDGSLGTAHAYIDSISEAGGNAVKFQTHIADAESTIHEPWRIKFSKQDATRYDYWKRMEFTLEQWRELKAHCDENHIVFIASPFSNKAVELLCNIGIDVWKIASGEVSNIPMITRVVETGLPVVFSSGMSYINEIDKSINLCKSNNTSYGVMQCTSMYPCPNDKIGLNMLDHFRSRYECPVGLSDHSGKIYAGFAAVAKGCNMLEVHVTFHKKSFGPDVSSSLDLDQFCELVKGVREIESMLNNPVDKCGIAESMIEMRVLFMKSLVANTHIAKGTILTSKMISFKKPGTGISSKDLDVYLGRTIKNDILQGEIIRTFDFV
jgi:N,N'-diacetyllegionaminate synthase